MAWTLVHQSKDYFCSGCQNIYHQSQLFLGLLSHVVVVVVNTYKHQTIDYFSLWFQRVFPTYTKKRTWMDWDISCRRNIQRYNKSKRFHFKLFKIKYVAHRCCRVIVVSKVCIRVKWPIRPELLPVSPSIKFAGTHLYTWVERHCESKVSCPRTQHNVPSQGLNPDHLIWRWAH